MLSLWLQGSLCSAPDAFKGEVICGGNPMVEVTLGLQACALLPRCPEQGFVSRHDWSVHQGFLLDHWADADNAEVRSDPAYVRGGPVFWGTSSNGNLEVCVDSSASLGEIIQGWVAVESKNEIDGKLRRKIISYRITVPGDTPTPDAGTPDSGPTLYCGDGIVTPPEACDPAAASGPPCTSACTLAPLVGIADAFLSPELPPGVETHFTGVTQFVMAELTEQGAELRVSCSLSGGVDCDMTFDASVPSGNPPMSEVALPPSMAAEQYEFSLRADQSGTLSAPFPLTAELRPSAGVLRCEQATNGLFGTDEVRWFGLQLETSLGTPLAEADYYMYERTTPGLGWSSPTGPFTGEPYFRLFGGNDYINPDRNFLIIAVDSMSGTVVAAREFRWDELEGGPTQACSVCDKSLNGDCTIIPLE